MTKVKVKVQPKKVKTPKNPFAKKPKKGDYHIVMQFNGEVFRTDTSDLAAFITEHRPHFLKTKLFFTITNAKGQVWEQAFFVPQGKQILRNKLALNIMLNRLIFK